METIGTPPLKITLPDDFTVVVFLGDSFGRAEQVMKQAKATLDLLWKSWRVNIIKNRSSITWELMHRYLKNWRSKSNNRKAEVPNPPPMLF